MHGLATLNIETRLSRILLVCGGAVHLLAGIAVVVCSLPPWTKAGLIVGVALALSRFGWQYGYRWGRGFIARLELLDGVWRLETGDGSLYRARLTGGYAHPGIVILNFRLQGGGRRSLALLRDATEVEMLRRLRVWLRTQRNEEGADRP